MYTVPALQQLSIGTPRALTTPDGKDFISAIAKEATAEAFLTFDGFRGDGIADKKHHGGTERAVCIYPVEHYAQWEQEFSCEITGPILGENLSVTGMLEEDVCIGDIYRIGEAVIQVTQGRIPCSTISKKTGLPKLMKRMIETGFTGYLCKVLEEGTVRHDSPVQLIERNPHGISILYANEVYFQRPRDVEGMKRILEADALAQEWQESLKKRLSKLQTI